MTMSASAMRRNLRLRDARSGHSARRSVLKNAPMKPPSAATATMKPAWRSMSMLLSACTLVKTMTPRSPNSESTVSENAARMAATKQRHATLRVQKEQASSMLKSTPPMGAPNAACAAPLRVSLAAFGVRVRSGPQRSCRWGCGA